MSKIGDWLATNWYWDKWHQANGWDTKRIKDLRRRDWKHRKKIANLRASTERAAQRHNRLEVFVLSPEAAELEQKDINPAYRGPPASRVNYPYRGRGQDFAR